MRLLNYKYITKNDLIDFISLHSIENSNSVLIQIFISNRKKEEIKELRDTLKELIPKCSLIITSTAGIVNSGEVIDDEIIISFSIFENSTTKDLGYCKKSIDDILLDINTNHINKDTKLIIAFANTFKIDSSLLLKKLTSQYPDIVIVGGNAGDDFRFQECIVTSSKHCDSDIVFAIIDSKTLKISTDYLFNWETIGRSMIVTRSEGSKVYEIDNKPIIKVYEHYLGKAVSQNLLAYGIQFPIVFKVQGTNVARALVAYDEDEGSITFAGDVPQGIEVKFGYANIEHIEEENSKHLLRTNKYKNEAIYIYTCGSRRQMLGSFLNKELKTLNNIGESVGFITYGEFFHNNTSCENSLLNITTTYVTLNENSANEQIVYDKENIDASSGDIKIRALTTLLKKTSEELDDNLYYLQQFKNTVESASIFSTTDAKGRITYANKNFEDISGFTKDELLGKPHNIVRDDSMESSVFKEMWDTISSGKIWKGLVKNRKKNGCNYYVVSEVAPIYNKDGSLKEYIGIRNDVTELEEYKQVLKSELLSSQESLEENVNYIKQFEEAMNLATAVIKTDTNNIIKFVNDKFVSLSGYAKKELIGKNCEEIRHQKHRDEGRCIQIQKKLQKSKIVFETMTNISKTGDEFITNTLFYPIKNTSKQIIEYVQIMFDVTDIYRLNEEIINTQKEVVEKMGAIGETRSKETGDHVKRVAEYSYLLAKLYGLSEEEALLLKQASPMHDIGKVGIPDNILNKPGKLTPEEFEVMKDHARIGYEMLKHSKRDILKASAVVAYSHHEKWDGSGYPLGLSKDDIHIFGRITAIADVFDALGHDRVYKKAWDLESIFELFKEQKGKHFDPKLIDLFFENQDKFLKIKDSFDGLKK